MPEIDQLRFQEALASVIGARREPSGIGTLSEKTLHAILKRYYEPYAENHEVKVGRYVADIVGERGIIEIQTAGLGPLKPKLDVFLDACPVTVVHPVAVSRRLGWIDRESGEISPLRRVPCKDPRAEMFLELSRVKDYLLRPGLTFCFPYLELDEYRYLNPRGKNPKRRASRCDKIPTAIREERVFRSLADYQSYLPPGLERQGTFTSAQFGRAAGCAVSTARVMLYVLNALGIVRRVDRKKDGYLYQIPDHPETGGCLTAKGCN